jgi:hypothetical protein
MLTKEFMRGVLAITTRADLDAAYTALRDQEREIRRRGQVEAMERFAIGDIVTCESKRRGGALTGRLEAFTPTAATILALRATELLFPGHAPRSWRVPPDMLRAATKEEKANWERMLKFQVRPGAPA